MSLPDLPPLPSGDGGGSSSSGGGSSSGSSSSSSSGGSAPAPKTEAQVLAERRAQRAIEELRRSYLEVLRRWGIRPSKNLMNLVERGIRGGWSTTSFVAQLRHTPEYRQHFKGISWKTGMTEGQYLSTFAQYKARAQDIGEKLDKKSFAKLLKRGVTMEEFSDRVDALAAIESYGPMWNQFRDVLEQRGIDVPGKALGKKELMKFLMGLGPEAWEKVWQETYLTTALEKVAGIGVVEKGETSVPDSYEITRGDLLTIIKQVEALSPGFEVESLTGQDWAAIGTRLRQYDMSYLQRYGLSTKDLLEMELGGPRAAQIAEKGQRVLKEQEAFLEPRAVPQQAQQVGSIGQQREELPQSL